MKELLLKKTVDTAFSIVEKRLTSAKARVVINTRELEAALAHHLAEVTSWCSEISFRDLRSAKATAASVIPLRVWVTPRSRLIDGEMNSSLELDALFTQPPLRGDTRPSGVELIETGEAIDRPPALSHLVLLGQPGAGKTTSMKHICYRILQDESFEPERFDLPILVRLRDFNRRRRSGAEESDPRMLISRIQQILDIRIDFPPSLQGPEQAEQRVGIRDRAIIDVIDGMRCVLILDGFDEIVFKTHRRSILDEIRDLAVQLQQSMLVVTSRTGEFNYHVDNTCQFEISPLNDAQIETFAVKWLGPEGGAHLLEDLRRSPFKDTAIRPLTIAHLCAIYERVGKIPDRPKTVYRKIVDLMLEDWDQQRSIKRETAYAGFEPDRKFEMLSNLAFVLTSSVGGAVFSKADLVRAYELIHDSFGLPKGEANNVVVELEGHTGLFVQAGFDRFEFSHRSLQEYLTAEYIVKLPSIPRDYRMMSRLSNELAVGVAISSRPSAYFSELVTERLSKWNLDLPFYRSFVSRLLLERPDFERSPGVGYALVQLYSRYVHTLLHHRDQLDLFVIDELARDFDRLADMIRDRLDVADLLSGYELKSKAEGSDAEPVYRLIRNASKGRHSGLHELYIRPSLLEGAEALIAITRDLTGRIWTPP